MITIMIIITLIFYVTIAIDRQELNITSKYLGDWPMGYIATLLFTLLIFVAKAFVTGEMTYFTII